MGDEKQSINLEWPNTVLYIQHTHLFNFLELSDRYSTKIGHEYQLPTVSQVYLQLQKMGTLFLHEISKNGNIQNVHVR